MILENIIIETHQCIYISILCFASAYPSHGVLSLLACYLKIHTILLLFLLCYI